MNQSLLSVFKHYAYALHDVLFPTVCAFCKKLIAKESIVCQACVAMLRPIVSAPLVITESTMITVFAVSDYVDPLRMLIQSKNYGNKAVFALLGRMMWQQTSLQYADFDIIVPVPLHWTRYARRWFNQSEELAYAISRQSGKPVVNLLVRKSKTKIQGMLSLKDRQVNVKDIFALSKDAHLYKNKRILLLDDVMTTGSTLKYASKALLRLRPTKIVGAVICRVATK